MTVPALLERVKAEGCTVTLAGNRLRLAAPRTLPLSLLEALRARKPEIVAHLREQAELALDRFEERAAILGHEAGLPREAAKEAALGEAMADERRAGEGALAGIIAGGRRTAPATDPEADARAMLALLAREGPVSYGVAATALGWGAARAWQAGARLEAARRISHDHLGRMALTAKGKGA